MKQQTIIHNLLKLGFRDESTVRYVRFVLDIKSFYLQYENGKFELHGNGGYDDEGLMELEHFQVKDITPLFKLLTGAKLIEYDVKFNFIEWREKLIKEENDRIERSKLFPESFSFPKFHSGLGFLDLLTKQNLSQSSYCWHEESYIKEDK